MLTPKEQKVVSIIRDNARPTGHPDDRSKSALRREQRTLLAIIDRLTGSAAIESCRLLVKWHNSVFTTGQALRLENGFPVDHTDLNEAARLAQISTGPARGPRHPMPYALDEAEYITPEMLAAAPTSDDILRAILCDDCPPPNHYTDGVRCTECPRRAKLTQGDRADDRTKP